MYLCLKYLIGVLVGSIDNVGLYTVLITKIYPIYLFYFNIYSIQCVTSKDEAIQTAYLALFFVLYCSYPQ